MHSRFGQTPSKKKLEITTLASNYHLEVNPSDVGIYDRVVVQELIKTCASTQQLDTTGQRQFKGSVLSVNAVFCDRYFPGEVIDNLKVSFVS